MSIEKYEDNCPGCEPAMLDTKTGKQLPQNHPWMKIVMELWTALPVEDKQAWHRVCCLNSTDIADRKMALQFTKAFTEAIWRSGASG